MQTKDRTNFYILACLLLFIAFSIGGVIWSASNVELNPYDKDDLQPATLLYLDKPYFYKNNITPDVLEEKIKRGDSFFVFYYNPACSGCEDSIEKIATNLKKSKAEVYVFNQLEYQKPYAYIKQEIHDYDYSLAYYSARTDFYLFGDEKFHDDYIEWVNVMKDMIIQIEL